RFGDARRSRSVWSACVFSAAFPSQATLRRPGGSWRAPFRFSACIGTMQPLTAWSPGFSRSKPFEPPKGGTPNRPGFMESPHGFDAVHWDLERCTAGARRSSVANQSFDYFCPPAHELPTWMGLVRQQPTMHGRKVIVILLGC